MSKRLDEIKSECEKENTLLYDLRYQATKQQAFVNNYKNNDPEFMKLRKTIEEEILRILSDSRALLKLAVLSIPESIRSNPDKYGCLGNNHSFYPSPSLATPTYDPSIYTPCQPWQAEEQEQEEEY